MPKNVVRAFITEVLLLMLRLRLSSIFPVNSSWCGGLLLVRNTLILPEIESQDFLRIRNVERDLSLFIKHYDLSHRFLQEFKFESYHQKNDTE